MTVSSDEERIGVALGRKMIKDRQEITEIAIYKRDKRTDKFELEKLRDFEYSDACIQFAFRNSNPHELLFFTMKNIFIFNFYDDSKPISTYYDFLNPLDDQPKFGVFNEDQTKLIVTSSLDILFVDIKKNLEIDLDDREEVSAIQNIISDNKHFYVLANKKEQRLGYYLFNVDLNNPDV